MKEKEEVNGGDLIAHVLKSEDVKHIFAVCGMQINFVLSAAEKRGINIISFRHEGGAASAADGYARASGEVGVAAHTAGMVGLVCEPLINSFRYGTPLVVLGAASRTAGKDTGQLQDLDQRLVARSITKWCDRIETWTRLPEYVGTAFRHAKAGFPGPAYLDLAQEVLTNKGDISTVNIPTPNQYRTKAQVAGDPEYIRQALKLLLNAEKPIILAGPDVFWSRGWDELREFAELTNIQVTYYLGLLGLIPYKHPLSVCGVNTSDADVALLIGERPNVNITRQFMTDPPLIGPDTNIIHVFPDQDTVGALFNIRLGIVGNAKTVLKQMIKETKKMQSQGQGTDHSKWLNTLQARKEEYNKKLKEMEDKFWNHRPIHLARLSREIIDAVDENATFVVDGANCTHWFRKWACTHDKYPRQTIDVLQTGISAVGPGIPMAIGTKLARMDRQVICFIGDGAFGQYAMELETAFHNRIPITVVVANNSGWGVFLGDQEWEASPRWEIFEQKIRYDKLAEALGCHGEYVEDPDEIKSALTRALEAASKGQPSLVNVVISVKNNNLRTSGFDKYITSK